jgi:hypothetical protein
MMVTASFPAQVIAVVFRRAAVFQLLPGELATLPGRAFRRAQQRGHVGLTDAPDIPAASRAPYTAPESVSLSDRNLSGNQVMAAIGARALLDDLDRILDIESGLDLVLGRAFDLELNLDLSTASARELIRDLARARDLAIDLAIGLDDELDLAGLRGYNLDPEVAGDLGVVGGLARDLASDLDRTLDLARDLAQYLETYRPRPREGDDARASDIALNRDLARELTRIVDLAVALGRTLARARDRARTRAPSEIDAAGADLSRANFSDLSLIEGVIWTRETIWPPGVAEQVERLSEEIAPGVYRVRGGTERDPSLVTT